MNLSGAISDAGDFVWEQLVLIWGEIKAFKVPLIAPILNIAVLICFVMTTLLFVEWVYMGVVITVVKLFRRTPEKRFKWQPLEEDAELGNASFPRVLVQIPMYNEKEVYKLSIGAVCGLSWPSDRIIVQVLDDSTDPTIKEMVEMECQKWASSGINIKYEIRDNRYGYKAGALSEGLKHSYVRECDYVVIFDADFQPEPDFLRRTIPFLVHNPDLALVQARWEFVEGHIPLNFSAWWLSSTVNADECLMTRMQEMSLNFHFTVEQEVGSSAYAFFSFNGTAGVWRIAAIDEAGGWNHRTTVEDMDLAVRASLKGWKFLYLAPLRVKSELPSTFKALRSFHLLAFWILFENVMAVHRAKATFAGLLGIGRVNEWVVTEKLGEAPKLKAATEAPTKPRFKITERMYFLELAMGVYLLICGSYDLVFGKRQYCWYVLLQAIAFFIAGFGYVGTFVPSS
nr:glucomannan 4-beta-mannosyltransferase 9-like [Ipomoea batatas]